MACKAAVVPASRRAGSAVLVLLSFVILFFLLGGTLAVHTQPHPAPDGARTRDYRYLMGTSVEVEAYGSSDEVRRPAIDRAFAAISEVDRLMSNYREDSELSQINRAARESIRVSDPMLSVLTAAQRVSAQSGGAFDITVGPIVRLWGFHDKIPHRPTTAELAAVRPLVDYRNLIIDTGQHSVRFARAGVELDLGGIAKGFAVEIAASVLRSGGLMGFIDAGGNQYLLGTPPGKRTWTVGIKDPERPARLLGVVETAETSVSTSAQSANFVEIDGRKMGHILDPHTLQPSDHAMSVTIFSRDATMADAMSKAAFILGPSEGLALVDRIPGMSAVIAYRRSDGTIGLSMSERLRAAFHRADEAARSEGR
jgi:thiamine biosynthesis lipoprotein